MSKLSHQEVLSQIQYGLISSCQPVDDGPMDKPEIVSAMAQACLLYTSPSPRGGLLSRMPSSA